MRVLLSIALLAAAAWPQVRSAGFAPFPNFESGPVEPVLVTPDGAHVLVLNTPDHRVEVFATGLGGAKTGQARPPHAAAGGPAPTPMSGGVGPIGGVPVAPMLSPVDSIPVGLEPVAMALHPLDSNRLFVSNHVSDTVSVVDLALGAVVATIDVGDEPCGLVVVDDELFVACARAPLAPPSPGQADPGPIVNHVLVIAEASEPYAWQGLVELGVVKPRDLVAVGGTLFVIAQNSGNRTAILDEEEALNLGMKQVLADAFDAPFTVNPVLVKPELVTPAFTRGWIVPNTGRIVFDSEQPAWVPQLADRDVVAVDAATLTVLAAATTAVGTTLFDIEALPDGRLWIAATEAKNRTRFEPNLRGAALDNRLVRVGAGPGARVEQIVSLEAHAQPTQLALGDDALYATTLGTSTLLALDLATGAILAERPTGPLPMGLARDEAHDLLYVLCRGDNTLRAYAGDGLVQVASQVLPYDPEPVSVSAGRRHLYEARPDAGHGNGTMSCASCHVFAHTDQVGWDLGDPGGSLSYYFPDVMTGVAGFPGSIVVAESTPILNPLKGPMVTQSLRGLLDPGTKDDAVNHWRGDRRALHQFRGAFAGLLGGPGLSPQQMQEFVTFTRSLRYAPNPLEPRDRQYTGLAATGRDIYGMNPLVPGKEYTAGTGLLCIGCHNGDFGAESDFTGSRPTVSAGSFQQLFNTAQLRGIYEKDFLSILGFGALHDGAVDGVRGFMDFTVPVAGNATFPNFTVQDKDAIAAFVKSWDSGLSPMVGGQLTLSADTVGDGGAANAWLDLAEAQAQPPVSDVDLVLRGVRHMPDGTLLPRGALFMQGPGGEWGYQFDTGTFASRALLISSAQAELVTLTFTAVPPGMGTRLGLDRDEDGLVDFVEFALGSSRTDPDSDGDGYVDGAEAALGGDPLVADASLPDSTPPAILGPAFVPQDPADVPTGPRALEVFVDSATIAFRTDEPAHATVRFGSAPGASDFATAEEEPGLLRTHDVLGIGLPAKTQVFFTVEAEDRDGNAASAGGSFTTLPPFFHVADLTLGKSGAGPYAVTATVLVHDHRNLPVAGVPVRGFWAGDIGGQNWKQDATTDGSGVATFALLPYTPAAATTASFSPAYIGSATASPYFAGLGGTIPNFFYDNTANLEHYLSIAVP